MALIGAHMSVAGGLDKAFERADALGCESMQIFTRSQRQWQARPVSLQEAEGFYRAWQRSNVKAVVSHASYLINIASPDAAVRAKSAAALREEVERCRHLNIDDIVLHPGFAMDAGVDAATTNIAETLLRLFDATQEYKTRILLETMAGQGTCVGGDLAHFTEILDKANWHPRIGLCIDTCHVFAAGYDLRSSDAYERLVAAADKHVGLSRVRCWHPQRQQGREGDAPRPPRASRRGRDRASSLRAADERRTLRRDADDTRDAEGGRRRRRQPLISAEGARTVAPRARRAFFFVPLRAALAL